MAGFVQTVIGAASGLFLFFALVMAILDGTGVLGNLCAIDARLGITPPAMYVCETRGKK